MEDIEKKRAIDEIQQIKTRIEHRMKIMRDMKDELKHINDEMKHDHEEMDRMDRVWNLNV